MSVHGVKSLACRTLSFSLRQARICRDLLIRLCLPLHSDPHIENICSTYACETGTYTTSSANGANPTAAEMQTSVLSTPCSAREYQCWLLSVGFLWGVYVTWSSTAVCKTLINVKFQDLSYARNGIGERLNFYTSAHGSGRRYYILPMKFLSFFFFHRRISEMALPTGNLSSSDGGIWV